jgi:hypothetical protein
MKDKHCWQCGEIMEYSRYIELLNDERVHFDFCNNPKCANYALLAVAVEDMPKEETIRS